MFLISRQKFFQVCFSRYRRKNGGKGRGGSVDFDDPVIFVDPRETTEFVGISITEPVTTTTTTMATTTTTQPPSK